MDKRKDLFVRFIEETQAQDQRDLAVDAALKALCEENGWFGGESYSRYKVINELFQEVVGDLLFEYANWYMYDHALDENGQLVLEIDGKETVVKSPEHLYDLVSGHIERS